MWDNKIINIISGIVATTIATLVLVFGITYAIEKRLPNGTIVTDTLGRDQVRNTFGFVPIGGMVAVMPNIQSIDAWQPPETGKIKDGFMRADGHTITAQNVADGSRFRVGTVLPNTIGRYFRGNSTSGFSDGANTVTITSSNLPAHTHGKGTLVNTQENSHTHSSALPAHRHFIQNRGSATVNTDHAHNFGTGNSGNHEHAVEGPSGHSLCTNYGGGTGNATFAFGISANPWSNVCYGDNWNTTHGGTHSHSGTTGLVTQSAAHAHNWGGWWSNDNSSIVGSPYGDGSGNTYQDGAGYWPVGGTRTTSAGSTHNHTISGSTDNGGFANTALNNEPAYVETIWVIRVI